MARLNNNDRLQMDVGQTIFNNRAASDVPLSREHHHLSEEDTHSTATLSNMPIFDEHEFQVKQNQKRMRLFFGFFAACVLLVVLIYLIIKAADCSHTFQTPTVNFHLEDVQSKVEADSIRQFNKKLTAKMHRQGSTNLLETVQYIKQVFESFTQSTVQLFSFAAPLSFAKSKPILELGSTPLTIDDRFNAYSHSADVEAEVVYANYGRDVDFALQPDANGSICLMRYGKQGRGSIVRKAAAHGCIAALLYNDPKDYAGNATNLTPNGYYLSTNYSQIGTIVPLKVRNFRTTPDLPTVRNVKYSSNNFEKDLPSIASIPITADNAKLILKNIEGQGDVAPDDWQGNLKLKYYLGKSSSKMKYVLQTELRDTDIRNIVATFPGREEPDRYVIVTCHHDAWFYGAVDPHSGGAIQLEVARVISLLHKEKWQPKRTILFISHGSEEYGLIGSNNFVKQFESRLGTGAVTVINLDAAIYGNYIPYFKAHPLLNHSITVTSQSTKYTGSQSMYDLWKSRATMGNKDRLIHPTSASSDFASYQFDLGIPASHSKFYHNLEENPGVSTSYPAYHTLADTFEYMDKFVDPGFSASATYARWAIQMVLKFSDSHILPLRCSDLLVYLQKSLANIDKHVNVSAAIPESYKSALRQEIKLFDDHCHDFTLKQLALDHKMTKQAATPSDFLSARRINDRLQQLSRVFVWPENSPSYRDILIPRSSTGPFSVPEFYRLYEAAKKATPTDHTVSDSNLNYEFSRLVVSIQRATMLLMDDSSFMYP